MKTSYKLAFAVCALIFTGSVVYWAKQKFSKHDDAGAGMVADAGATGASPTDLTSPTAPAGVPAGSGAALTSPQPPGPDTGAAAPTAPPPPVDVIAVAPPAPATSTAAPVAPIAPPAPAPEVKTESKPEVKTVAKTEAKAPAPTAPAAGKTYAVRSGDTLTSISQKFFGDKNHTDEIYKANRKTIGSNPNALKVGMKLAIPAK